MDTARVSNAEAARGEDMDCCARVISHSQCMLFTDSVLFLQLPQFCVKMVCFSWQSYELVNEGIKVDTERSL
jgi:hypothetical protein